MTIDEALSLITQVAEGVSTNFETHKKIQEALTIIRNEINKNKATSLDK